MVLAKLRGHSGPYRISDPRDKPTPRGSPQISETLMGNLFTTVRISAGLWVIKIVLQDDG